MSESADAVNRLAESASHSYDAQSPAERQGGPMRRIKLLTCGILVTVALSTFTATTSAETPRPEGPGCSGKILAAFNHGSGTGGASGNPDSSAGPGYFLKAETPAVL